VGEELHEVLQNSSNEEYKEDKDSIGTNVDIGEKADETEESAIQGKDEGRERERGGGGVCVCVVAASCTTNQTFL
jgi:hypothetical protein